MANGIQTINVSFKGISPRFTVLQLATGKLFSFPTPQNIVINEGVEQKQQLGKNETGETVRLFSYPTSRQPTATVTFGHMQPEITAMRLGVELEEANYSLMAPGPNLWVTKGEYDGVSNGQYGYGLSEDVNLNQDNAPMASVKRGVISVPLTQRAWNDYDNWRDEQMSFAIGANTALRFSDDIVDAQDVVSTMVPYTSTMTFFSDRSIGALAIAGVVVDSTDRVHILQIYQSTVDLSNAGLDMSADTAELALFLNNPPGSCRAWNLYSPATNNEVACAAA